MYFLLLVLSSLVAAASRGESPTVRSPDATPPPSLAADASSAGVAPAVLEGHASGSAAENLVAPLAPNLRGRARLDMQAPVPEANEEEQAVANSRAAGKEEETAKAATAAKSRAMAEAEAEIAPAASSAAQERWTADEAEQERPGAEQNDQTARVAPDEMEAGAKSVEEEEVAAAATAAEDESALDVVERAAALRVQQAIEAFRPVPEAEARAAAAEWQTHVDAAVQRGDVESLVELAEQKVIGMLTSSSTAKSAMFHDAEVLGLQWTDHGEPSLSLLLDVLQLKPLERLDMVTDLIGEWSLEYTKDLPNSVREEVERLVEDEIINLAVAMSIKGDGRVAIKATILLISGEEKIVNLHRRMTQENDSPYFSIKDQDGETTLIQVLYASKNVLMWRSDVSGDRILESALEAQGLPPAPPHTEVWRRVDRSPARVRPGAGPASLWRFGLPYHAVGMSYFDKADSDDEESPSGVSTPALDNKEPEQVERVSPGKFTWDQTPTEVTVEIPVEECTKRDLIVELGPGTVYVCRKGVVLLKGELFDRIACAESTWHLEEGRLLCMSLEKVKTASWKDFIRTGAA